jgi:hypothetical protein
MKDIKLLCPKETARILGVSDGTLAVWRCNKTYNLPYIKIGNRVRYRSDAVMQFIDSREIINAGR